MQYRRKLDGIKSRSLRFVELCLCIA